MSTYCFLTFTKAYLNMDDETADLMLALHLQDLEDARSTTKGKGRVGDEASDADLALQLQQEEFEQATVQMTDHRMARSIHRAVQDDGASIVILASQENREATDRDMACRLSGQTPQTALQLHDLAADEDTISRFSAFNIEDDSEEDTASSGSSSESNEAEGSSWAASRKPKRSESHQRQCVSCREYKKVVELPCQHLYCRRCIRHLFADAAVDETLFPPRCCRQQIPISLVRHFLDSGLTARFERKAIEFGTLNRTYCYEASCATFIEPSHIHGSTGTCFASGCGRRTCTLCKRVAHAGDCPQDNTFEDLIRLAQESGWQQCERCQNMIELRIGCNHIT